MFKDTILNTIISNDLFSKYLATYIIDTNPSNYVTSDDKVILGSDNKVLLHNDKNTDYDNSNYFMSKYNAEEIDNILQTIDNY